MNGYDARSRALTPLNCQLSPSSRLAGEPTFVFTSQSLFPAVVVPELYGHLPFAIIAIHSFPPGGMSHEMEFCCRVVLPSSCPIISAMAGAQVRKGARKGLGHTSSLGCMCCSCIACCRPRCTAVQLLFVSAPWEADRPACQLGSLFVCPGIVKKKSHTSPYCLNPQTVPQYASRGQIHLSVGNAGGQRAFCRHRHHGGTAGLRTPLSVTFVPYHGLLTAPLYGPRTGIIKP